MTGLRFHSAARSHVGLVRTQNEDAALDRPDLGLWVVADGMGGMTAGEVASQAIVAALGQPYAELAPSDFLHEIRQRLDRVNAELRAFAAQREATIGSTIAGLLVRSGFFVCFWAGDSRVYRHRAGDLDRLTRDHSLVQEMVDSGLLPPEQADCHPRANVISRAVGVEDSLALECAHARVEPGDVFLLCSDGLTRSVTDEELERHLARAPIEAAIDSLLALVLERGAKDNVTIVLVACHREQTT